MPDRRLGLFALVSYLLIAVLVVGWKTLATPDLVVGRGIDLPGTVWIHWWIGRSVSEGTLPITTDLLFYPDGKNFFTDTGANYLDALVGVPLQWIFGVPDFLDWLQVVLLAGNALAMQALARQLVGGSSPAAVWAAAVAFEVNPFVLQQVNEGRPTQVMLWFGALAVRSLLRVPTGTWRDGALFGLFMALQGLTYWFTVYFLTLALLPLALVYVVRSPRDVLPRLALAVAVAVGVTSPFLVGIATAIDSGEVRRLGFDLLEESPVSAPARWRLVMDQLGSSAGIVTVGLGLFSLRRAWPLLAGAALAVTFSFGGRLDVTDPPVTNHLFVTLWDNLPLLPRLGFPDRAAMATFLLLPMAAALGLARVDKVYAWIFAFVFVGEGFWRGGLPVSATPCGVPTAAQVIKDQGGAVIFLPFGANDDAMVHQTFHGQPLFGGMGEREADMRPAAYDARLKNSFVIMLGGTLNDTETPIAYTAEDRAEISSLFRWVWFDRRYGPPLWRELGYDADRKYRRLVRELGQPVTETRAFALWDLHQPIPADAPGLGPLARSTGGELERLPTGNLGPGQKGATGQKGAAGGPRPPAITGGAGRGVPAQGGPRRD